MIQTYHQLLKAVFADYRGDYDKLLIKVPSLFNLLQELYITDWISWETRFKINCVFSYFAIPDDLINDETEAIGYIDDLYVCSYVLSDILKEEQDSIKVFYNNLEDLKKMIDEALRGCEIILGEKCIEILNYTGLLKFNDLRENLVFLKTPGRVEDKILRLKDENLNLIGLLRSLLLVEGKKPKGPFLRDMKELFTTEEWNLVIRILEEVEIFHLKYDSGHEKILEKIRRKVILEINEDLLMD